MGLYPMPLTTSTRGPAECGLAAWAARMTSVATERDRAMVRDRAQSRLRGAYLVDCRRWAGRTELLVPRHLPGREPRLWAWAGQRPGRTRSRDGGRGGVLGQRGDDA